MSRLILYGHPGWGSAIIEAQLDWFGLDFEFAAIGDLSAATAARAALAALNPLLQVPTLVLEDGTVMTESAAITLHLADAARRDDFVPAPDAPERPAFLRWLVFIVANIYPTYTYADEPARFLPDAAAREGFCNTVDDYAKRLYRQLDAAAGAPWFLGQRFSALDIYIAVLTHWRPGRGWFTTNTPRLTAIARAAEALPALAAVWARNFPESD